jgi:hypothetical protein
MHSQPRHYVVVVVAGVGVEKKEIKQETQKGRKF